MNGRTARRNLTLAAIVLAGAAGLAAVPRASGQSLADTVQAINKARVTTRILYVTAHPDDETAGLLAYLSRGLYADVAVLTITRGQGGQNAIGPEQDGPLGVVRTTELLAADSHYGVHQFFTRAVDPGFSKSPERTMKIWGDHIPLEDMVRVIRMYRPDVVINGWGGVHFGHGQHQASGILTPQAVADAADPAKFPEQIAQGLAPWKVSLELRPGSFGFGPADDTHGAGRRAIAGERRFAGVGTELRGNGNGRARAASVAGHAVVFRQSIFSPRADVDRGTRAGRRRRVSMRRSWRNRSRRWPNAFRNGKARWRQRSLQRIRTLRRHRNRRWSWIAQPRRNLCAAAGKEIAGLRQKISSAGGARKPGRALGTRPIHETNRRRARGRRGPAGGHAGEPPRTGGGRNFTVDVNFLDKPAAPVKWTVDKSSLLLPEGWSAKLDDADARGSNYHFTVSIPRGSETAEFAGRCGAAISSAAGETGVAHERGRLRIHIRKTRGIGRGENHGHRGLSARTRSGRDADGRAFAGDGAGEARGGSRRFAGASALPRDETGGRIRGTRCAAGVERGADRGVEFFRRREISWCATS